jgi:hypothetical protein
MPACITLLGDCMCRFTLLEHCLAGIAMLALIVPLVLCTVLLGKLCGSTATLVW